MDNKNDLLLARIEQEIESREEFTFLAAPPAPEAPKNPFPDPVCFLYW